MKIINLFFALIGLAAFRPPVASASAPAMFNLAPLLSSLFAPEVVVPLTIDALEEELYRVMLQEKNKNNLYRYLVEKRELLSTTPLRGSTKRQVQLLGMCQSMVEGLEAEWTAQRQRAEDKRDQTARVRERMQTLYISKHRSTPIAPHLMRSFYPREKH